MKFTTIVVLLSTLASPILAEGDAKSGAKVFKKCKACHAVGDDAKNRVGPALNGIVGSPAAENPNFKYSKGMVAAAEEGLIWDTDSLTSFLTKPRDFIKGTKMSFAGLRKQSEIDDVIAYLETFN